MQVINHALICGCIPVAGDMWESYIGAGGWTLNQESRSALKDQYAAGEEITYTWTEEAASGYELVSTEVSKDGYTTTLTNKYTPETISLTVVKAWEDEEDAEGFRPDHIDAQLFADGEQIRTIRISEAEDWTATVAELPKYAAGEEIVYSWSEYELPESYTYSGYTVSEDGLTTTLVNVHELTYVDATVTKNWNDAENQDCKRPASIKVKLLANGTEVRSADVKEVNGEWKFEFNNLPEFEAGTKITYTITEEAVEGYETEITGDAVAGFSITNTHTPETVDTNFYCHVASSWNRCKPLHRTSFSVLAKARKRCNEYKRLNKTGPLPKRREPVPETDGGCAFHRSVVYLFSA